MIPEGFCFLHTKIRRCILYEYTLFSFFFPFFSVLLFAILASPGPPSLAWREYGRHDMAWSSMTWLMDGSEGMSPVWNEMGCNWPSWTGACLSDVDQSWERKLLTSNGWDYERGWEDSGPYPTSQMDFVLSDRGTFVWGINGTEWGQDRQIATIERNKCMDVYGLID